MRKGNVINTFIPYIYISVANNVESLDIVNDIK